VLTIQPVEVEPVVDEYALRAARAAVSPAARDATCDDLVGVHGVESIAESWDPRRCSVFVSIEERDVTLVYIHAAAVGQRLLSFQRGSRDVVAWQEEVVEVGSWLPFGPSMVAGGVALVSEDRRSGTLAVAVYSSEPLGDDRRRVVVALNGDELDSRTVLRSRENAAVAQVHLGPRHSMGLFYGWLGSSDIVAGVRMTDQALEIPIAFVPPSHY